MLIGDLRPKTLQGIKSLAKQLCKEQGMQRCVALDCAAEAANFSNFRHARHALSKRQDQLESFYVLLTMYWCDKDQGYRIGRETVRIELSKPILEICGKSAFKKVRGFQGLRMVADDHFICDKVVPSQTYARRRLYDAARSLHFMEHTRLQPYPNYRNDYPHGSAGDTLPNSDHVTNWVDPESGQLILIDEPYKDNTDDVARAVWATRSGWQVLKTSWPGMYNPYSCDLYIATNIESGYDLNFLLTKINAMPMPLLDSDWLGESSPSWDTFLSPMAKTAQDKRRAHCRGTIRRVPSKKSVPYTYNPNSFHRRPAGAMGIDEHLQAGHIIKAAIRSGHLSYPAFNRLNSLRSTLEDWMLLEIDQGQHERPDCLDVYYRDTAGHAPYKEKAATRAGIVAMLENLKQMLRAAYPDCAPLRQQLRRIDMSAALLGNVSHTAR